MKPASTWSVIYHKIKRELDSGKYSPGAVFPTERELKVRFKTTHLTVRKALKLLVGEGYIKREVGKGTTVVRAGKTGSRPKGGLRTAWLLLESLDDFFSGWLTSLEAGLRLRHIRMVVSIHRGEDQATRTLYDQAVEDPEGFVVLFPAGEEDSWLRFHPGLSRTLIVDGLFEGLPAPQILSDDFSGVREAVRLLAQKDRTVAHIAAYQKATGRIRHLAYQRALQELSLPYQETLVADGFFTLDGGRQAARQILAARPETRSFFCANDLCAAGAREALKEMNIPLEEIRLVGYGNTVLSEIMGISSVDQDISAQVGGVLRLVDEYQRTGKFPLKTHLIKPQVVFRA